MSNEFATADQKKQSGKNAQLNRLRAAVLGANDGIVSVASIVLGVAGATSTEGTIFTAGLAGLFAGALSMAVGEYVSVSTQRDTERSFIERERLELEANPEEEMIELAEIYEAKGLSKELAQQIARELTQHDALAAHLDAELNIDPDDLTNPWEAAAASMGAFTLGGLIPLISILIASNSVRVPVTFAAVLMALIITGFVSAVASDAPRTKAIVRIVIGGSLAMIVTYGIGRLFGTAIG